MNRSRSPMQRIESIYVLLERIHSGVLHRRTLEVRETDSAIHEQLHHSISASLRRHKAIVEGDTLCRLAAERQHQLSQGMKQRLEHLRKEREQARQEAMETYRQSYIQSEQVKTILAQVQAEQNRITHRRDQAEMDDRFLSRLRWAEGRS